MNKNNKWGMIFFGMFGLEYKVHDINASADKPIMFGGIFTLDGQPCGSINLAPS